MTAKYNKELKEWSLVLSNTEMATIADCALFAVVEGGDEYAKEKQRKIQGVYDFIIGSLCKREP